jgi:hypothetical protein
MLATGQPISSGLRNRLAALFKAKPAFLTKFRTDLASIIVNTQIASDQSQQAVDNPTISLSNDLSSKCQELLIGQLINFYEIHTFRNDLDKKKLLRLSKEGNVIINYKSNLESSKISIQIGDFKREYDIPREGSNCAPKNTTN